MCVGPGDHFSRRSRYVQLLRCDANLVFAVRKIGGGGRSGFQGHGATEAFLQPPLNTANRRGREVRIQSQLACRIDVFGKPVESTGVSEEGQQLGRAAFA